MNFDIGFVRVEYTIIMISFIFIDPVLKYSSKKKKIKTKRCKIICKSVKNVASYVLYINPNNNFLYKCRNDYIFWIWLKVVFIFYYYMYIETNNFDKLQLKEFPLK